MISNCERCRQSPCDCGYDYLSWDLKKLDTTIRMLEYVRAFRLANLPPEDFQRFMRGMSDEAATRGPTVVPERLQVRRAGLKVSP